MVRRTVAVVVRPLVSSAYVEFVAAGAPVDDQSAGVTWTGRLMVGPAVLALCSMVGPAVLALCSMVLCWRSCGLELRCTVLVRAVLGWAVLGWAVLGWAVLVWAVLGWAVLGWAVLGWKGS